MRIRSILLLAVALVLGLLLAGCGDRPSTTPADTPVETTDAFLVGFVRRDYAAVLLLQAAHGQEPILAGVQVLVSMIVITLFIPCIAHVFVIIKELGPRVAVAMVLFIFPVAFLVGGLVMRLLHLLGVSL